MGKTTLKKRLLKTIKNLITSGVVSPSGGLEKPISVIIGETRECVTIVMESDFDWQPQRDLLDEAQRVLEFIDKSHQSLPTSHPTTVLPKPVCPTPFPAPAMLAPATPVATTAVPSKSAPDSPTPRGGQADSLEDAKKLMQEVLSSRKLRSIKDIEKTTTLYFMDTGGQPEFHEIMPIILNGPALHLIFFNLAFDLDERIPIRFCHQNGTDSTITYVSNYTGKQMIYQLLSSLYYLSKDLSPDSKPAAVLIATYLDQLKDQGEQGEKKIDDISDSLNKLLNNAEFHSKGFITYPTEGKATVFIPINNYSGDEEEIHQLQAFLKRVIGDRFAPVELPSSWLLFHLVLRHRYENSPGVCKLAECQALAKGCGLDEKDVPQVLRYIHRRLGTVLFYEEVEGLNELVICDPNVLFNSIYQLVAVSFAGVRAHHTSAGEIRKTGEIPSEELQHISSQPSSSLLTTKHIVDLLKHFKILTEMVSDDSLTYFMPCLLHHDSLELSCEALKSLGPPPLLICFDGNYIPIGVFSALVVKLSQCSWEPDREIRYRNHILFNTDGVFPVELRVHPAYLEFRVTIINYKEEEPTEIHEFCMEVCKTVVDTLKSILSLHEHTKKTKFQLGFYCPGSFQADGQPHFCGCLPRRNYINPKSFVCSKSSQCQKQCRLPPECTIWFDCWKVCCNFLQVFCLLSSHAVHCESLQPKAFVCPLLLLRTRQLAGYVIMSAVLTMLPEQVIFLIMICLTVLGMSVFIVILKGVQARYKYSLFVLVCVT